MTKFQVGDRVGFRSLVNQGYVFLGTILHVSDQPGGLRYKIQRDPYIELGFDHGDDAVYFRSENDVMSMAEALLVQATGGLPT